LGASFREIRIYILKSFFKELDYKELFSLMKKPACLFDGRRIVDQEKLRKIGFRVFVVGSASNQALNFFP